MKQSVKSLVIGSTLLSAISVFVLVSKKRKKDKEVIIIEKDDNFDGYIDNVESIDPNNRKYTSINIYQEEEKVKEKVI